VGRTGRPGTIFAIMAYGHHEAAAPPMELLSLIRDGDLQRARGWDGHKTPPLEFVLRGPVRRPAARPRWKLAEQSLPSALAHRGTKGWLILRNTGGEAGNSNR